MKKTILILIMTAIAASPVLAIEYFDEIKYCRKLTEAANSGYSFESSCRERELKAKRELHARAIPSEIVQYCTDLTIAADSGNSFLKSCIEREMKAKKSLGY